MLIYSAIAPTPAYMGLHVQWTPLNIQCIYCMAVSCSSGHFPVAQLHKVPLKCASNIHLGSWGLHGG